MTEIRLVRAIELPLDQSEDTMPDIGLLASVALQKEATARYELRKENLHKAFDHGVDMRILAHLAEGVYVAKLQLPSFRLN